MNVLKPLAVLSLLVLPSSVLATPDAHASELRLAPAKNGSLGAWLIIGPYRSSTYGMKPAPSGPEALTQPPPGLNEATIAPNFGAAWGPPPNEKIKDPPRWLIASSGEGPIDVRAALQSRESDLVAYAAATLHVERAGRFFLLIGADDGLRVIVDGKPIFTRDESRPERDDDDLVPLDLTAGDHAVVLKLHQRDAGWALHVRLVDAALQPPPGSYLALPGTREGDTRALAAKMSWVSVDRGLTADHYQPRLTVRFPEGIPLGVPLGVQAKLVSAKGDVFFDVNAGGISPESGEMVAVLPSIAQGDLPRIEDQNWTYELTVAERSVKAPFYPRRVVREAVGRIDRVLGQATLPRSLARGSIESVTHLRERLVNFTTHGDGDIESQLADAQELSDAATALEKKLDPYANRTGPIRRAYRSPVDGELAEYGVYLPPEYRRGAGRTYPLVVALHGLNGHPMAMLRWFFGADDPKKDQDWEDRHVGLLPPLDAIVVTPNGHGNTMYRHLGQDDVMRAIEEVAALYPIDRSRITITGPSMGGIGAAALALRHPDTFAAAAPLCGYHSYFVRRDFIGRPLRPWEKSLAEERSNVFWAWNGKNLPLYVVHGTQDLPESNSGVLVERYESLKYNVIHEHPPLGHNVWQTTYEELKGAKWLLAQRPTNLHPTQIRFRTMRLRDGNDAWLHVGELAAPGTWAEVEARVRTRTRIELTTRSTTAISLDRDPLLVDATKPLTVVVDGTALVFPPEDPLSLHREEDTWKAGPAVHEGVFKHGEITGPLRDAFHAPLLFVYGASDPQQTRANEEVARAWAQIRWGVDVHYPMMSDVEFTARGESVANDHALFLVGNSRSNIVLRALEADLPIRVDGEAIVTAGGRRFTGSQVGAAFIRPNPRRTDRYLVVVEGVGALGTWRSLSLPDLLPDFIVYDERVAPARGQMNLSAGMVLAGGFFQNDWSLPTEIADPFAAVARPAARSEHDATPYLP